MPPPRGHRRPFCAQRARRGTGGWGTGGPHSRDGPGAAPLPAGPGLSAHPGGAGTEPSDKAPQKPEPPPAGGEAHTWPGATGASRCAHTCPPPLLPTEPTLATVCGTDPPPDSGTRPPPVVRHRGGQGRAGDALRCGDARGVERGAVDALTEIHGLVALGALGCHGGRAERSGAVPCGAVPCCAVLPAPPGPRPLPEVGGAGAGLPASRLPGPARLGPAAGATPELRVPPGGARSGRGRAGSGDGAAGAAPVAPTRVHRRRRTARAAPSNPPLLPPPRSRPRVNLPLLLIPLRQSAPSLPPQLAQPRHRRLPQAPAPAGPGGRAGAQGILRRVFSGWDNRESQLSSQDDGPDTETLAGDDARDNAVGGGGVRAGGTSSPQPARPARSTGPRPPRASLRHFARSPWKRPCQKSLPARRDARGRAAPPGASCAAGARHGGGSEDPRRPSGAEPSAAAPQGRASPAGRR